MPLSAQIELAIGDGTTALVLAMIAKPTEESFHRMNQALKARAEQPAPARAAG